jgi:hypothetical protein
LKFNGPHSVETLRLAVRNFTEYCDDDFPNSRFRYKSQSRIREYCAKDTRPRTGSHVGTWDNARNTALRRKRKKRDDIVSHCD